MRGSDCARLIPLPDDVLEEQEQEEEKEEKEQEAERCGKNSCAQESREGGRSKGKRRRVCVLSERRKAESESDERALARRGALRASVCAAGTQFTCFTVGEEH